MSIAWQNFNFYFCGSKNPVAAPNDTVKKKKFQFVNYW